jgi:hypothetical protein
MSAKIEITGEFAGANRTDAVGWRKPEGDNQDLHLTFAIAKASDAPATQPFGRKARQPMRQLQASRGDVFALYYRDAQPVHRNHEKNLD